MVAILKACPVLHKQVCMTRERKCLVSRFSHIEIRKQRWQTMKEAMSQHSQMNSGMISRSMSARKLHFHAYVHND